MELLPKTAAHQQQILRSRPIVIEFVGMMGSGKSTITSLVIEELHRRGHKCPSQKQIVSWMNKSGFNNSPQSPGILEKLKYYSTASYLFAALQFPVVAFKSYRYALSVQPQNLESWQVSRYPMNWMEILKKNTRNTPYDVIVFEEATLQYVNCVPLYAKQFSRRAQKDLISRLIAKENHVVVFTKIDADMALKRIKRRAAECHSKNMLAWEFEKETEDYQRQKAIHAINIYESTLTHLKTLIPHSLIELDSLKNPEENATLVVEFIEKILQ
jgi:thymidylate kinase